MFQSESSKIGPSTSRRHKRQHTINDTQHNRITVAFVPWVLLGSVPLFLWVQLGSDVPLGSVGPVNLLIDCFFGFCCSVGTVGFCCFVEFRWFQWFPLFCWSLGPLDSFVSLVSVVLLGSLVPLGCLVSLVPLGIAVHMQIEPNPSRRQHSTT